MQGYSPDLQALLDLGELNYKRILALFPAWRERDEGSLEWHMGLSSLPGEVNVVTFKVLRREKYTTSMEVAFKDIIWVDGKLKEQKMFVRLYHDARTAEVVFSDQKNIMLGCYRYPNENMHQKDEKMQSNLFLGECLINCEIHYRNATRRIGIADGLNIK